MTIFRARPSMTCEANDFFNGGVRTPDLEDILDLFDSSLKDERAIGGDYDDAVDIRPEVAIPNRKIIAEVGDVCHHSLLVDVIPDIVDDSKLLRTRTELARRYQLA
jgi:hypothetical protein